MFVQIAFELLLHFIPSNFMPDRYSSNFMARQVYKYNLFNFTFEMVVFFLIFFFEFYFVVVNDNLRISFACTCSHHILYTDRFIDKGLYFYMLKRCFAHFSVIL